MQSRYLYANALEPVYPEVAHQNNLPNHQPGQFRMMHGSIPCIQVGIQSITSDLEVLITPPPQHHSNRPVPCFLMRPP